MPPKGSNSSKTAHVMNLISRNRPSPGATGETSPAQAPGAGDAQAPSRPAPQVPPLIASMQNDIAIASEIKDALENTLASDLAPEGSAPTEEPVSAEPVPAEEPAPEEPVPTEEPAPVETAPAEEPAPVETAPAEEPVPVETAPAEPVPAETVPAEEPAPEEPVPVETAPVCETEVINMMQRLVEQKVDKYIDLFGLCACGQCRNDVVALSMNDLPPKYIAMPPREAKMRSVIYEGRYDTAITAQILRSCRTVLEHPRHGQPSKP